MSLTAVWVPLWWKAVGRCWLRKSVCCSLVPCRDHLRQKVLELQLSIASPSVQLVSSGPAPPQCSCTGPGPILASLLLHLGKANQTLFALYLQHRFPVRACLRSALTCIQLLHTPSMACKCHFSQTVPESRILIYFFLQRCTDDVFKWSFKRKCWATWEVRIFHFSQSSAVSQFSFISGGQNFLWKFLISDLWLTFFFLPLPVWIEGIILTAIFSLTFLRWRCNARTWKTCLSYCILQQSTEMTQDASEEGRVSSCTQSWNKCFPLKVEWKLSEVTSVHGIKFLN